ncbi:hypothetical protein HMPREF0653_02400 [Prevotella disiens JCM 6334 = ATCC 29426]|uniref:Uncharacterized protein n=1 Tax=Prevotella disiens JCM 6334 = ATCC 29426 TaxID=1235811 RepID=A0ABP2Y504_9BACT|nr:hypothetical protein HMPREF0653_02400 [Prevotella disiens JCM 6334 = ATCC 29426]
MFFYLSKEVASRKNIKKIQRKGFAVKPFRCHYLFPYSCDSR